MTSNLWQQCLQNEALQQRYSPCKSEKPNIKREIENDFHKNPNFHFKKKILSDLVKTNRSTTFSEWISWQVIWNWWFHRIVCSDLKSAQTSEHCTDMAEWLAGVGLHCEPCHPHQFHIVQYKTTKPLTKMMMMMMMIVLMMTLMIISSLQHVWPCQSSCWRRCRSS